MCPLNEAFSLLSDINSERERASKMTRSEINAIRMDDIRSTVVSNLIEKMSVQHIHKLGEAQVGDRVQVPMPDVDRGPGDLTNALAYILKVCKFYKIHWFN